RRLACQMAERRCSASLNAKYSSGLNSLGRGEDGGSMTYPGGGGLRSGCSKKLSNGGRGSGNVRHVTKPTPPIHSTDRISHSRNSPRATRNVGFPNPRD